MTTSIRVWVLYPAGCYRAIDYNDKEAFYVLPCAIDDWRSGMAAGMAAEMAAVKDDVASEW